MLPGVSLLFVVHRHWHSLVPLSLTSLLESFPTPPTITEPGPLTNMVDSE
jgi:hypothetical protein